MSLSDLSDTGEKSPKLPNSPYFHRRQGSSSSLDEVLKSKVSAERRAELERKRQKLEEIRKQKKIQEELNKQKSIEKSVKKVPNIEDEVASLLSIGKPIFRPNISFDDLTLPRIDFYRKEKPKLPPQLTLSEKLKKLSSEQINQISIPPREQVVYTKQTQTITQTEDYEDDDNEDIDIKIENLPHFHKMPHVEFVKPPQMIENAEKKEENQVLELSENEKQQIIHSLEFKTFFAHAAKVIERALDEDDIFVNYSSNASDDREGFAKSEANLSLLREFCDDHYSKGRIVTSLDWSTQHSELLLASYNENESFTNEPDGIVLVWNAKFKNTSPEFVFHCQSQVMSACFAKFHPNLIIGSTYSGQIVLWDNRSDKRVPVQRSPLVTATHTHPVYCIDVVGTLNAHNLITLSTDGKLCSWSIDMLSAPQDTIFLQTKQSKSVAALCMSFPSEETNNFVIGSEEGLSYTACRHGSHSGILETYEGHQGPITGIDYYRCSSSTLSPRLFLTSSFDWTIKLWKIKEMKPLYSFEDNSDYVYDVRWSPNHPALFGSVDGMGRLDIWNLNNDIEAPTASEIIDSNVALNCLKWNPSGRQIAVGDDCGKIYLYEIDEHLAVPSQDDWTKFAEILQNSTNMLAEDEKVEETSSRSRSASSISI